MEMNKMAARILKGNYSMRGNEHCQHEPVHSRVKFTRNTGAQLIEINN